MIKKIVSGLLAGLLVTAISCSEDEKISGGQTTAVQDASAADAYLGDAGDVSISAYNTPESAKLSGRSASGGKLVYTFQVTADTRLKDASITLTTADNNTTANPKGTIVIDFGDGKTDPAGTVRKGKIVVSYSGLRFITGSTFTITFDGYYVNGMKVEGTRTVTTGTVVTGSVTFSIKDENGKVTFTDGSTVTRTSTHTRKWTKGATVAADKWTVEGTASGTGRDSKAYTVNITRALVFKAECALKKILAPSEGEALITVDSVPLQINYGDVGAACDNFAKVTVNGFTKDISIQGN